MASHSIFNIRDDYVSYEFFKLCLITTFAGKSVAAKRKPVVVPTTKSHKRLDTKRRSGGYLLYFLRERERERLRLRERERVDGNPNSSDRNNLNK